MSASKSSPILRPAIVGTGFFVFFYAYLIAKGRDASAAKLTLIGSWALVGVVVVSVLQAMRKKEFGWGGTIAGVLGITFLAGAIMSVLKTGQIFTP